MDPTKKDPKNVPPPRQNPGEDNGPGMSPQKRALMAWLIAGAMFALMLVMINYRAGQHTEIPYSPDFRDLVTQGNVRKCEIVREVNGVTYVRGEIAPETQGAADIPQRFRVNVMPGERLEEFLDAHDVHYRYVNQNPYFLNLLGDLLPVLLIFGLLYFLFMRQMRQVGHGAMSFGKSRAKMLNRDRQKVTFKNVAGIEEAKEEVQEIIEYLKTPQQFQKLGGRIPKGVMLMGPPGAGKTLLAKAIAGEADVPFFSISGSDFVEMFVGVGASRVRDMFEQGKKNAPCIIFIDEIDAVGRSRFTGIGGGHDEREQTLNALLVEMDGFETTDGVIILAATNRPDVLDPALMRPGRFDRQIVIDLPSMEGREEILKIHAEKLKLHPEVDLKRIARGTPGFSGADLSNLLNEAALLAARENKKAIEESDLEEARDKVMWGRERRGRVLDEKEKRITAFHEAGHAVAMCFVNQGEPLHKVTIIPRGMSLGSTMFLPERDRYLESRTKMKGFLVTMMSGRVAEEKFIGDITQGARDDLHKATQLARAMVCEWGMSGTLGPRTYGAREEVMFLGREVARHQDYSEETAQKIDREVDAILREAFRTATEILDRNAVRVRMLADRLLEQETLDGREAEEIIRHGRSALKKAAGDAAEKNRTDAGDASSGAALDKKEPEAVSAPPKEVPGPPPSSETTPAAPVSPPQ